jgi:hypothetical protein
MKTQAHFISLFILFLLSMVSTSAAAQQWYKAELVVFERYSGANAEHWPEMRSINNGSLSPSANNNLIKPAGTGLLSGVVSRLNNASNYRVLFHQAWQQPIMSKGSARSIQINSSNGLVEGQIKLYRVNYLHADIDVWFKENGNLPVSSTGAATESQTYPNNPHLSQIRRIRSKNLIYFDHPRVAAILEIVPVATPASAVSKTPETYSLPEN